MLTNVDNMLTNVDNMLTNNINTYECLICHKLYKERTGLFKHKKKHLNYEEEVKKINSNKKENEDINLLKQKLETTEQELKKTEQKLEIIKMNQKILTAKKKIIKKQNYK